MDKLTNSQITLERGLLDGGISCTFFISDLDMAYAPPGALARLDEMIEAFGEAMCNILNIPEEGYRW